MRILITNDDGIFSDGIVRLARAAKKFGEVYVIAPDHQCSAMAHSITLRGKIAVREYDFPVEGVHAYSTSGTPADCVRFGYRNIMKRDVDAVFSGINVGFNSGSDIQYSATVGAAMEAATEGIHAIAFSEGLKHHEVTDMYLEELMGEYLKKPLEHDTIWNINFPDCPMADFKGILRDRTVALNSFFNDSYVEEIADNGDTLMSVSGALVTDAAEGTDFRAIVDNCISVGIVRNLQS